MAQPIKKEEEKGCTGSKQAQGGGVHPMVAVPDAIRIVLEETAKVVLLCNSTTTTDRIETVSVVGSNFNATSLLGKRLAEDVTMCSPGYPPYNASIMDGYVIQTKGQTTYSNGGGDDDEEWTHSVLDKVYAGDDETQKNRAVANNDNQEVTLLPSAYYITTGAVVPASFDCVVPIEECVLSDDKTKIKISSSFERKEWKWIRKIGCDIPPGSVVLPRGHKLDAVSMGLIKQSGVRDIKLQRRVQVGVLSTGNELISVHDDANKMRPGQIPDVNRPILLSLLSTLPEESCGAIDLGMERDDDEESLLKCIQSAREKCDVIITTGGVSMGETDIMEHVLLNRLGGTLHFGRMHMKPGKPTTFVTLPPGNNGNQQPTLVFAMPGNPVSATVCTHLVARPSLHLLYHYGLSPHESDNEESDKTKQIQQIVQTAWVPTEIQARLAKDIKLDKQRPEYHRVILSSQQQHDNDSSYYVATSTGIQQSSRLMSLRDAQGLLVLPQALPGNQGIAKAGDVYTVILLGNDKNGIAPPTQVQNSYHLNPNRKKKEVAVSKTKPKPSLQIGIVQVTSSSTTTTEDVSNQVKNALSGSKSGAATIVSSQVYSAAKESTEEDFWKYITKAVADITKTDLLVVSCGSFKGSFQYYCKLSRFLRTKLVKVADALGLEARRGCAAACPETALLDVVVGFLPPQDNSNSKNNTLLICLPQDGIESGLSNVRGLLKHALQTHRGKCTHGR